MKTGGFHPSRPRAAPAAEVCRDLRPRVLSLKGQNRVAVELALHYGFPLKFAAEFSAMTRRLFLALAVPAALALTALRKLWSLSSEPVGFSDGAFFDDGAGFAHSLNDKDSDQ
jgi:hypothetical protein